MDSSWFSSREVEFMLDLALSLICGFIIGYERERKNKPAGISTQTLVIAGAMLFAFMSRTVGEGDPARIAAQIVSGVGFLGAGIILKSERRDKILNLTTAASIWYAAAIGMALGFNMHVIAVVSAFFAVAVARIPRINKKYNQE